MSVILPVYDGKWALGFVVHVIALDRLRALQVHAFVFEVQRVQFQCLSQQNPYWFSLKIIEELLQFEHSSLFQAEDIFLITDFSTEIYRPQKIKWEKTYSWKWFFEKWFVFFKSLCVPFRFSFFGIQLCDRSLKTRYSFLKCSFSDISVAMLRSKLWSPYKLWDSYLARKIKLPVKLSFLLVILKSFLQRQFRLILKHPASNQTIMTFSSFGHF